MSAVPTPVKVMRRRVKTSGAELMDSFAARRSPELVIAFAGAIGCGIQSAIETTVEQLEERNYTVVRVKLSAFLQEALTEGVIPTFSCPDGSSARYVRYRRLQQAGKELRKRTGNPAILAEYAIQQILVDRNGRYEASGGSLDILGPVLPARIAYIVDQVKRPEEVALLRAVYRNIFYLAGITRIKERRVEELEQEQVRADEVHGLIEIDRHEDGDDGQQLDKTLHLADYFVRNDAKTVQDKRLKISRFLKLVHGDKSVTPTDSEHGMYAAYSAGLRSACLSRQVGASIATKTGEVISTGCNDVPKAGGGLYTTSFAGVDMRCIHRDGQQCSNDLHKQQLRDDIGNQIEQTLKTICRGGEPIVLSTIERSSLLDSIYKNTGIRDLIEFSRSVHAEMDAIVALVRTGSGGIAGSTLYTTTFPCHNCARHIVAAGITKVYYIEPYEKSLAKDLHSDSIAFEVEESTAATPNRVEFLHFEGVAPRQFNNLFRAESRKNATGKFIAISSRTAEKRLPEYIDAYQDFETKAVQHLDSEMNRLRQNIAV